MSQHIDPTPKEMNLETLNSKLTSQDITNQLTIDSAVTVTTKKMFLTGNIVTLFLECKFPTSASALIGTLSSAYKPKVTLYFPVSDELSNTMVGLLRIVHTDGKITVNNNNALTSHNLGIFSATWAI